MNGRSVEVSVVLPAYNEAETIEHTVRTTIETLEAFLPATAFEVIVAEDGCEDRTPEIAERLAAEDGRIRHVHSEARLGRGGALEHAFRAAEGETLAYFDTDLATDMRHLEELIESVRSRDYDVVTGSRWIDGNEADRPAKRGIPSKGYNWLVRTVLRSDLRDHQCGFKAFDRSVLFELLQEVDDEHWFWDTEVLTYAQRQNYNVKEFPVDWTPKGDTKVDLVRDVFGMGSQILRTWWQLSVRPRITRRVTILAGLLLSIVAIGLMTLYLDPGAVWTHMQDADLVLVLVAGVVYLLSWPLRGSRYRDILSELGYRERRGFLTGAIFISQTGNLVFPARLGDPIRAYVVKARRRIPYPTGFASLAVERVFDLLTITAMAGFVLVGLVATGGTDEIARALAGGEGTVSQSAAETAITVASGIGIAAIGAVVVIALSARSDRNYVRAILRRLSTDSYVEFVAGVLERFVGDVQRVAGTRGSLAKIGGTSALIWGIDVLTAVIVLKAFGTGLEMTTLLAVGFFAVSVGNLAKVLPLSPGGIGLYEAAFTVLVAGLTPIVGPVAFGAAVVDHAVKNGVTVLGGVVSMLALNVSLTTAVDEGPKGSRDRDTDVEPTESAD
jgi:uncharacterized protein (TIRG00374 family)